MPQNEFKFTGESWMPLTTLNGIRAAYAERCEIELPQILITNLISNVLFLRERREAVLGVKELAGKRPNMPAVIVGLGPSLDKHLHLLYERQKEVIIIALDATLPVLDKHNIVPDYVAVIDPRDRQASNFADIFIDPVRTLIVLPSIVHTKVLETVPLAAVRMYNLDHPESPIHLTAPRYTGDLGTFKGGALTSATAFQLALLLGCGPITFIGHDLSWPSPDKVYASDAFEWKTEIQRQVKFKSNCMLFPDIHGELVLTHFTFVVFWAWIRDYIKTHGLTGIYNSSEAGILQTDELKAIPFAEFIDDNAKEGAHGGHVNTHADSH